jgi:hypothetical protein
MKAILFYLGLGTLFTHELDAMTHHEWRVLPVLSLLPDDIGVTVFVLAHIPIFALLLALVASSNALVRTRTRNVISGFLVLHGLLHALYIAHPNYEFSGGLSNFLIFGGAAFGAVFLALQLWSRPEATS